MPTPHSIATDRCASARKSTSRRSTIGFRGHFASKSRRYSTTLGAIRGERRTFRRRQAADLARQLGLDPVDEDTTLVVSRWESAGLGYLTGGDAALALSAAARARERRDAARDHLTTVRVLEDCS